MSYMGFISIIAGFILGWLTRSEYEKRKKKKIKQAQG